MPTNLFLWVEGLHGESREAAHEGWIEVISFSWGATSSGDPDDFNGKTPADFQDLSVSKVLDISSPSLALLCGEGRKIEQVVLEAFAAGSPRRPIFRYILSDCAITSVSQSASTYGDGSSISEEISIGYERIEWQYFLTNPDGSQSEPFRTSYIISRPLTRPANLSSPVGLRQSVQLNTYIPKTAFILMWMDPERPELEDVHKTIKEVCGKFDIQARRADDVQHDDRITDVILECIRTSEFVIADLTGERPNVYYEVGHAHAVGKRPILLRRKGSQLHFDLAVHNVREYRNLTELGEILARRFEALLR